jgi:adenosine deaminase/adenosine deaminase CECR1
MTIQNQIVTLAIVLILAGCATSSGMAPNLKTGHAAATTPTERAAAWFENHRARPTLLRTFIQRMPKGGDIHTHASGAVYAESYIAWAAEADLCVVPTTGAITDRPCNPDDGEMPIRQAIHDIALYGAIVDALSTRNLPFAGRSGHDQFFSTFAKFGGGSKGDQVAELVARAAAQHIIYVEIMLTLGDSAARDIGRRIGFDGNFALTRDKLLAAGLRQEVEQGRRDLDMIEARVNELLRCQGGRPEAGCLVTRRSLQQTTRTNPPEQVYAQLVYAFELVRADPRVVGINLVGPEDHPIALRDYTLQMKMLGFLADQYPDVPVALHAGELTLGLVPPKHLRFHIREAIHIAKAKRIGHGVDISYEDDALALMDDMKKRNVLIEICLTSNDIILGVKGAEHPFPDYLHAGVPVTIASDDEGVARIDLSHEYWRAATTYGLGYRDLKTLARNSLTYSFLNGASLWQSTNPFRVIDACANDPLGDPAPSTACKDFLNRSDRARIQWRLEKEFIEFEGLLWLQ